MLVHIVEVPVQSESQLDHSLEKAWVPWMIVNFRNSEVDQVPKFGSSEIWKLAKFGSTFSENGRNFQNSISDFGKRIFPVHFRLLARTALLRHKLDGLSLLYSGDISHGAIADTGVEKADSIDDACIGAFLEIQVQTGLHYLSRLAVSINIPYG